MPNRTAYAGTAADGDVYTAANHARMPGGWIGYELKTADQDVNSGSDVEVLSRAVTVGPNRLIRVAFFAPAVRLFNLAGGAATLVAFVKIKADGVQIARGELRGPTTSTAADALVVPVAIAVLATPTAGAHTYSVSISTTAADKRASVLAGTSAPATLLVEDLGPSS